MGGEESAGPLRPNPEGGATERARFDDAALVLVAHGSTQFAGAASLVYRHADVLRRSGRFGQVMECFWKQEPYVWALWRRVCLPRVFVVPYFVSEGYFSQQVIPRELGLPVNPSGGTVLGQRHGGQLVHYCPPLGSHPGMTALLHRAARRVIEAHPFPRPPAGAQTALFIAGHGTREHSGSRLAVERQVSRLTAERAFAEVHPLFLEESPRVEDCPRLTSLPNLVIVPFFLTDGSHTMKDIPRLLGESAAVIGRRLGSGQFPWRNPTQKDGRWIWYSRCVGHEPAIPELIVELVHQAAARCGSALP
jgi:sirohydrochlorin cobaltochelatase